MADIDQKLPLLDQKTKVLSEENAGLRKTIYRLQKALVSSGSTQQVCHGKEVTSSSDSADHGHEHEHEHGDNCGHQKIQHDDHYDFVVGDELHHHHEGHCDFHGVIKRRVVGQKELIEVVPSTSLQRGSSEVKQRRNELSLQHGDDHAAHKSHRRDLLRFTAMFFITGGFFFVELIWGIKSESLALVADAMHMLSDFVALCVGYFALRVSKRPATAKHTFGFSRAEVVGGLMNGTFLIALCFSIAVESVGRFVEPPREKLAENSMNVIIVACVGLGANLIGLVIFGHGDHGHSHGGDDDHGHSHGGNDAKGHDEHEHEHEHEHEEEMAHGHSHGGESKGDHGHSHSHSHGGHGGHDDHGHSHGGSNSNNSSKKKKKHKEHRNLNIHGVFLHVLGDAFGSVAVIISGLIIHFSDSDNRFLADPISSLVITTIILVSTIPLVKKCVRVLLQAVPNSVDLEDVRTELLRVDGVQQLHDLHVWQLNSQTIVGSVHVLLQEGADFMRISDKMKLIMHKHGIHYSTLQPEYVARGQAMSKTESCHEPLCPTKDCSTRACCAPAPKEEAGQTV